MFVVEGRAAQVLGDAAVNERAGQAPIEGKRDGVDVVERTIQTPAAARCAAGLEKLRKTGCGTSGRSAVCPARLAYIAGRVVPAQQRPANDAGTRAGRADYDEIRIGTQSGGLIQKSEEVRGEQHHAEQMTVGPESVKIELQ